MLSKINPTRTAAWKKLKAHKAEIQKTDLKTLFKNDPNRFDKYSQIFEGSLFDYSKNIATQETFNLLFELAKETQLEAAIQKMFNGEKINETENRAVLHIALRNQSNRPILLSGRDVMPNVNRVLDQMESFCNDLHEGKWKGFSGEKIESIVNIGIGGSDLGPVMVTEALKPYWKKGIQCYFVSNVDGTHIAETLKKVNPATVLNALNMKKVAIHNFLKGLMENASLKLLKISFKLPPIVLKVNGSKLSSNFVDLLLIKMAGTIANIINIIPTQIANVLVAVSAFGNQEGSYITTQNQGAITHAH